MLSIFTWIEQNLRPQYCSTEELIYNDMESQSGRSLPLVYQPFVATRKGHWAALGGIYDYVHSTGTKGKSLLDFGPGDGWPSLVVAPHVKEVVGLDASSKRVEVCRKNAERLNITNAEFLSYTPGETLPFPDQSFDGVVACSSVEQTPDPKATLVELFRVLKPGGGLRLQYEGLARYRGGQEQDLWTMGINGENTKMILYNRDIKNEMALQYALTLNISEAKVYEILSVDDQLAFSKVTVALLEEIRPQITRVQATKTVHPSCATWISWLRELGFSRSLPTHNGRRVAASLFDQFTDANRPGDRQEIEDLIKIGANVAVSLECPLDMDPNITAIK